MHSQHTEPLSDLEATPLSSGPRYVFGADIGATNLRLGLADATGAIIGRWAASTADVRSASAVVELICAGAEELLLQTGVARKAVVAIAAGGPGITDVDRGVVIATSYLMGWSEVPLGAMLERALSIPAAIDNDVNLAALGESWAGSATRSQRLRLHGNWNRDWGGNCSQWQELPRQRMDRGRDWLHACAWWLGRAGGTRSAGQPGGDRGRVRDSVAVEGAME